MPFEATPAGSGLEPICPANANPWATRRALSAARNLLFIAKRPVRVGVGALYTDLHRK